MRLGKVKDPRTVDKHVFVAQSKSKYSKHFYSPHKIFLILENFGSNWEHKHIKMYNKPCSQYKLGPS